MQSAGRGGAVGGVGAAVAQRGPGPSRRQAGFSLGASAAVPAGPAAMAAPALRGLDPLLAMQAEDADDRPPASGREAALSLRAMAVLEVLGDLQHALLGGRGPADRARLQALADGLTEAGPAADPALAEILAAVALRARIELARRGDPGP